RSMTNIIRITLVLILTCTSSIGVARWVGQAHPSSIGKLFTKPDGTPCRHPCLFGIQPDETPYTKAAALLRSHPLTRGLKSNLAGYIWGDQSMAVILQSNIPGYIWGSQSMGVNLQSEADDGQQFVELAIRTAASPISEGMSLGDVISAFGVPDQIENTSTYIWIYYDARRLMFIHRHGTPYRIDIADAFDSLTVYAKPPGLPSDGLPWRGFRNY